MIRFRRSVQTLCLVVFLFLLTIAAISGISMVSLDLFLRMDPALVFISAVSARVILISFIPAIIVLLSGAFIGRVFCGYICPMGITLDVTDALFRFTDKSYLFSKNLLRIKYLVLVFLLGSALFGVSYIFTASPLSLITRFYGLVIFPVISFLSKGSLDIFRPLGDMLDITAIQFVQVRSIRFNTQFFILCFFILIFSMVKFSPRFWCRYLCPSGALLALFSRSPLIHRQVSDRCNQCGQCVEKCPMSAIDIKTPEKTFYSECIVCRTCEAVCPERAVTFDLFKKSEAISPGVFSPGRRQLISSGMIGAGTAVVSLTGLNSLYAKPGEGRVNPPGLIRPPGAAKEIDFLARCTRCGECMTACPTNTLQPVWLTAGFPAIFSPAVTPRRGYCDPQCHECGTVCPTDAIRFIDQSDRTWAKTGTAVITRQKCLAWEFKKSCMVCDEVCPYDAINFLKEKGSKVPVPHVTENRCAGCGYCEHFCPVQNQAAIEVTPMDAIRGNQGKYESEARLKGFKLSLKTSGKGTTPVELFPETTEGTAPGFDE